ncbi:cholinesterase [Lutzomyia longipalpis]|uniref:cholinesterase n=1 Tax=Lutzomyia longipalpis TaxID=7200 RepID=UPI0024832F09|nr:cholinesterase [Lutzomyia longipalpis]
MFLVKIVVCFLLFQLVEVVYGARELPMVTIPDQGTLMGTYLKMFRIQTVVAYLGVPYAQPPINENRFAPPVVDNLPTWEGVRNASQLPADCLQSATRTPKKHEEALQAIIVPQSAAVGSSMVSSGGSGSGDGDVTTASPPRLYDEDCLYLNVYIPDAPPPPDGYAVIAWLHGGDFSSGSATELNPFQLVLKQKVIVVSIAYRLGIFGFLTTADGEAPGNFGLMDQSAALLWVKRNIKLFGGNEASITAMGHASGAISVGLHLISGDWSEGLFTRAIMMSGSPLLETNVREAKAYGSALDRTAKTFGCFRRPTSKLINCLRNVPAQILADSAPVNDWGPVIDDGLSNQTTPFVPDAPKALVERGQIHKVPLMIGFTDMEEVLELAVGDILTEGISSEMYDTLLGDMVLNELSQFESNDSCAGNNQIVIDAVNFVYKPYPPTMEPTVLRKRFIDFSTEKKFAAPAISLAAAMSQKKGDVFAYRFDMKARSAGVLEGVPEWVGVPHGFDALFVWGLPYWAQLPSGAQWDRADKQIAEIIMTLWANFAKFGNPTEMGVYIKWEKFTADSPGILIVDRAFNMSDRSNMNYGSVQFWNEYYPKVVTFASQCCNATNVAASWHTDIPREATGILLLAHFGNFLATLIART